MHSRRPKRAPGLLPHAHTHPHTHTHTINVPAELPAAKRPEQNCGQVLGHSLTPPTPLNTPRGVTFEA